MSLATEILQDFEPQIAELVLVPSSGGVFEVELDGELIFSKKAIARHAHASEVTDILRKRLDPESQK